MTRYLRVRLDDGTAARLDGLCAASGRSPSEVVRLAIVAMHCRDHLDQGVEGAP